jgi:hypothetical protein
MGNLATGIAAFLTNYHQGREAEKASNKQDFLSDVQLMMLGIPVSHVEMAKKAKKAGMDLDFENDNNPAVAAQANNAQVGQQFGQAAAAASPALQQMLTAQTRGLSQDMSGGVDTPSTQPSMSLPAGQMQPIPPPTPAPSRNLFQRLADQYTGGPEPNPNSTGMQWLRQLAGQGSEEARQTEQQRQMRGGMLDIMGRAIKGDPQALAMATRLPEGYNLKSMPFDDLRSLGMTVGASPADTAKAIMYHALGGPQAMQHMMTMAEKFAPKFGGNLGQAMKYVMDTSGTGYSSLKPGLSIEEETKVQDTIDKMSKLYPKAPLNLMRTYANLEFLGNKPAAAQISNYLSNHYEREGTLKQNEFNTTNEWHMAEMKQAAWIHSENLDLGLKKAILDATGEAGKNAWEMIHDKNSSEDTKQAGYQMLADTMSKLADIPVNFKGANGKQQTTSLGVSGMTADRVRYLIRADKFNMYERGGGGTLSQFTGYNPGGPKTTLDKMIGQTKQGFEDWWKRENFLGDQSADAGAGEEPPAND